MADNDFALSSFVNELRQLIAQSFPEKPIPKPGNLIKNMRGGKEPEIVEIQRALAGRSWRVAPASIFKKYNVLPLLTDTAYLYFIPAQMFCALDFLWKADLHLERCIYNLSPYDSNGRVISYMLERCRSLSEKQTYAVTAFFCFLRQHAFGLIADPHSMMICDFWLNGKAEEGKGGMS